MFSGIASPDIGSGAIGSRETVPSGSMHKRRVGATKLAKNGLATAHLETGLVRNARQAGDAGYGGSGEARSRPGGGERSRGRSHDNAPHLLEFDQHRRRGGR